MRDYDTYGRSVVDVSVGEHGVTLSRRSGAIVHAEIIHAERDEATGEIVYALLDRKAHEDHASYGEWEMSGCFTTEMRRHVERDDDETGSLIRDHVSAVLAGRVPDDVVEKISAHVAEQSKLIDYWNRDYKPDCLRGWIVQELDAADAGDLDLLEAWARRIIGLCKSAIR